MKQVYTRRWHAASIVYLSFNNYAQREDWRWYPARVGKRMLNALRVMILPRVIIQQQHRHFWIDNLGL